MKITKNKIFSGILIFGLVTNLLLHFDIQYFYLRAIFSFVFLTTIPGLLIMLMLRIRKIGFWKYFFYMIGFSIAFLIFAGLTLNLILPWLHITDKPFSLYPILISFDIFILIFGVIAYKRNKQILLEIKLPKLDWLSRVFFIIPVSFPILGIFGAIILNNGGTNTISLFNYAIISLSVLVLYLLRQRVDSRVYPLFILMIAISFLLSGWLRSYYVSGIDVSTEYQVFQITQTAQIWKPLNYINIYNSCLSLTILPTILSIFLKINDQYIYKLFIPLLFSITPIVIYYISRKYITKPLSFLAAFFFMSQPAFTTWAYISIRQEIAFIFFALSMLVLLSKSLDIKIRNVLFTTFSISMIVSHYSTAYIALVVFSLMYLFRKIYCFIYRKKKIFYYHPTPISGITLISLIVFTYVWYAHLTFGFNYVIEFVNNSIKNINNIFTNKVQAQGQSLFDLINVFKLYKIDNSTLNKYINESTQFYHQNNPVGSFYNNSTLSQYIIKLKETNGLPWLNVSADYYLSLIRNFFKLFGVVLIVIGTIYSLFKKNIRKKGDLFLNLASFLIFFVLVITPFISVDYDLTRIYQQILIVLSFASVLGLACILNHFKLKILLNFAGIFFICYMMLMSLFTQQYVGGNNVSMVFNNTGKGYSMYYTHSTDLASAKWLSKNYSINSVIFADYIGNTKLRLSDVSRDLDFIKLDVLPTTLIKNSYVYLNYANVIDGVAFKFYKGVFFTYNYPSLFLADNKNLIYNNSASEIFK